MIYNPVANFETHPLFISNRCISGLMSYLIKKSWTDAMVGGSRKLSVGEWVWKSLKLC